MKFLLDVRVLVSLGAALGFLAYVPYGWVFVRLPLPIAVPLAFAVFFPGLVGHVIVANTLLSRVNIDGVRSYVHVPTLFTETLGVVVSMLVGAAVAYAAYIVWRMFEAK